MEKEIKIIASLMTGLPQKTRRMLILTTRICDTFHTQLERHGEVAFSNIHSILRDKEKKDIAHKVAEMMGLILLRRKKNPESRRKGLAWRPK